MGKVKRSEFATFINTGTPSVPDWALLGEGIVSGTLNYNPQTTTEAYINQDAATTDIDSYQPSFPVEASHIEGNDAIDYLDGLRNAGPPVLDAAVTEIVNVRLYETPTVGEYPAHKQDVSVQFDSYGGDGGTAAKLNCTLNYRDDPVAGTFNPVTLAFTEASA